MVFKEYLAKHYFVVSVELLLHKLITLGWVILSLVS